MMQTLREMIANGVAYVHEGLSDTELRVVRQIFNSGAAQVILCAVPCLSWLARLIAYLQRSR